MRFPAFTLILSHNSGTRNEAPLEDDYRVNIAVLILPPLSQPPFNPAEGEAVMAHYEENLMDELDEAEAEGMAESYDEMDELDEFGEGDGMDEMDELDEGDAMDALDEGDEMESWDEFDEGDEAGDESSVDEALAFALAAEDSDEFFRRLARIARRVVSTAANVARRAAPVIGQVARAAAPILSVIPHPAAQLRPAWRAWPVSSAWRVPLKKKRLKRCLNLPRATLPRRRSPPPWPPARCCAAPPLPFQPLPASALCGRCARQRTRLSIRAVLLRCAPFPASSGASAEPLPCVTRRRLRVRRLH